MLSRFINDIQNIAVIIAVIVIIPFGIGGGNIT